MGAHEDSTGLTHSAPTTPYASVAHGDFKYVGYTGVYNVVDYAAVSFPSEVFVDKLKDEAITDSEPQSEYCEATRASCKNDTVKYEVLVTNPHDR